MSPNFWPVVPQTTQVWTNNSGAVWQNHNSGMYDHRYENHEVEHYERSSNKGNDWLIGGVVGNTIASFVAPDDPDAARAIGTLSNMAMLIGGIKNAGDREVYHRERHDWGQNRGGWNHTTTGGWHNNSSQVIVQDYGMPSIPYLNWNNYP